MTAAQDCTVRLWTSEGAHIGSFGRDTWRLGNPASYGPVPRLATQEAATAWDPPPLHPMADSEQAEESAVFLTCVDSAAADTCAAAPTVALSHSADLPAMEDGPRSMVERERLLEQRAQEGVQRALGSMSSEIVTQTRLSGGVPRCSGAGLRQAASAPLLPPLETAFEDQVEKVENELERAHARARSSLAAKVAAHRSNSSGNSSGSASEDFLLMRERAARSFKPQPRKLPTHDLAPLRRREPSARVASSLRPL